MDTVKRLHTPTATLTMLLLVWTTLAGAQTAARKLTTIDGLRRFSGYFHLQNVILRGEFAEAGDRIVLRAGDNDMRVMLTDVVPPSGPVEVRAQLIDIGRLTAGDPRLERYDHRPDPEHWPTPGEELLLNVTGVVPAEPVSAPTVRVLTLEPWRFDGQSITVTGQFGGRNLLGDLPASPAKTRYDFVLRGGGGGGGAVWITGLQPKGKGFDLNVDARVDTSRWLQVSGVLRRERGLVVLEAKTIATAAAPAVTRADPVEEAPLQREPGEVVFSSPTDGETNVSPSAPVRVQFSRGIDMPSTNGRLRIGYVDGADPSLSEPKPIEVQVSYNVGTRAIELRFRNPLEASRTVKLELLDGVRTFDGGLVKPWTLTFTVGAN